MTTSSCLFRDCDADASTTLERQGYVFHLCTGCARHIERTGKLPARREQPNRYLGPARWTCRGWHGDRLPTLDHYDRR